MRELNYVPTQKHTSFSYWIDKIEKNSLDELLFGSMDQKSITTESVFLYMGYYDQHKDIFKSGWRLHENEHALLGYLSHLLIPTVYYNWIDRLSEGFFIPMSTYEIVKSEVMHSMYSGINRLNPKIQTGVQAKSYADALDTFMQTVKHGLSSKSFLLSDTVIDQFNALFNDEPHRKWFIKIMRTTDEVKRFVLEKYCSFDEVFEEETGMAIDDFSQMCDHVYTMPLVNRTFIERLNFLVPICF